MDIKIARKRAEELVNQMTAEEKMSQLLYNSPAIERLGIKDYNWWNEASHGVARAGVATVFPHAIALASTFNPELINTVADAISTEGRAKYNKSIEFGDRDIFKGLTYWAPNINIFRDPRWGRGQETFGEDPYLTAILAAEFIDGIQGDGEFLKAAACAKHYAVHSGPERLRHEFDAKATEKDLWETYLPAFEYTVKNGVIGVMGAYNRTNGEPCCASKRLIGEILRGQWGFEGYFVSDCGAIADISEHHKVVGTKKEGAAEALKNGCNLNCGDTYKYLIDAYEEDLIDDDDITNAAVILYTVRIMLGEFEENRPYSDIPYSKVDCKEHKELNLKAAKESLVLLKNDNYLPLKDNQPKKIAVVGPNAMSREVLEGNYNGHASEYITVADGVRRVFTDSDIIVATGSNIYVEQLNSWDGARYLLSEGLAAASEADLTILCLGLNRHFEGEDTGHDDDFSDYGDRKTLNLPKTQMKLAEAVCDVAKNLVVVVMCGSATDVGEKVRNHAKAIIHGWYPGAVGGLAIAELIAGEYSPMGRLPLSFYHADGKMPSFEDYNMEGRTYRFTDENILYPFGYGLTYTTVEYKDFKVLSADENEISVEVTMTNTGDYDTVEKMQIYSHYDDSRTKTPLYQLCKIEAVEIKSNETKTVTTTIDRHWIKAVLEDGVRVTPDGKITLYVGGHQPDKLSENLAGYPCLKITL
ncbi:MAG: glycoside hydrolase family 3 C-terminal domain-containing protein [Clostridia bacterium]|nr:glycoside hydrolase family 3 C-terminal domain-containing protein [Clostridia bacterium]